MSNYPSLSVSDDSCGGKHLHETLGALLQFVSGIAGMMACTVFGLRAKRA